MTKHANETGPDAVGTPVERGVGRLVAWWQRLRDRRRWTTEMQMEHLRNLVMADHRWLAHDKTADALTERYLAALAPDWFRRVHEDPSNFRQRIGLNPPNGYHPCGNAFEPRACWRVRCQLGRECVESSVPGEPPNVGGNRLAPTQEQR